MQRYLTSHGIHKGLKFDPEGRHGAAILTGGKSRKDGCTKLTITGPEGTVIHDGPRVLVRPNDPGSFPDTRLDRCFYVYSFFTTDLTGKLYTV